MSEPSGTASNLRERAQRCLEQARLVSDPSDKAMLLHMAEMWLDLARTRERGELIGAGPDIPNEEAATAPRITHAPEDR